MARRRIRSVTVPRPPRQGWFAYLAGKAAHFAGRATTFFLATMLVVVWGLTGPLFDYSDTWQLVINTSTTIVTFLMVFLIQNTQNRDTTALQVKLDALIFANHGTANRLAAAELMSDRELEHLHDEYSKRAVHMLAALKRRRSSRKSRRRKT